MAIAQIGQIAVIRSDGYGGYEQLPSSGLGFQTRVPEVASVDSEVRVTAAGQGKTEVTVFDREKSFTVRIRVLALRSTQGCLGQNQQEKMEEL
ncbi:hypothetical protein NST84_15590 [Paenibacillus sp. FSL R7-0345]|uniref:hypothetical protein n=1 Tax=Paenibacillus sp. FSL R7-0345 TaxID=2954535 RepID=UPI00315A81AD